MITFKDTETIITSWGKLDIGNNYIFDIDARGLGNREDCVTILFKVIKQVGYEEYEECFKQKSRPGDIIGERAPGVKYYLIDLVD